MPTQPKSLIEKLNSAAADAQNPDQIVAKLATMGWIRLLDMTPEQAELLDQKRCVVGADNGGAPRPFWIVAGSNRESWVFDAAGWYPPSRGVSEFWFILYEEYRDGSVPDCFAYQT